MRTPLAVSYTDIIRCLVAACCGSAVLAISSAGAQSPQAAEPIVGLRENPLRSFALTHARVVTQPGHELVDATVLIKDTAIVAVGTDLPIPAGAKVIDCTGRTIYAGLIDAWSEVETPVPASTDQAAYWNRNVTPQRSTATVAGRAVADAQKLRSQGITARLLAPQGGIVKGRSSVVLLNDTESTFGDSTREPTGRRVLKEDVWNHLQLTVPRQSVGERYPNSPMGAVALLRQAMLDAKWYGDAWAAYQNNPALPRPEQNIALQRLNGAIAGETFVIDAPNERMALRAKSIAGEFSLDYILRGSGREYRQLAEIAKTPVRLLLPVDFPDAPDVATKVAARETTLQTLMHWDLAPENPGRVAAAGIPFCLTTDGLSDPAKWLKQVRLAVERGLDADAALSAMTTTPARWLGIEDAAGRVQPGMLANLVITDGDLFQPKTKVMQTWVAGQAFTVTPESKSDDDPLAGIYRFRTRIDKTSLLGELHLQVKDGKWSGTLETIEPEAAPATTPKAKPKKSDAKDAAAAPSKQQVKLEQLVRQRDRLTASVNLYEWMPELPAGVSQLTCVSVSGSADPATPALFVTLTLPSGATVPVTLDLIPEPSSEEENAADKEPTGESPAENAVAEASAEPTDAVGPEANHATPILYPLGAYGLAEPISGAKQIMLRGATIWTGDEAGVIATGDLLIVDGRIEAVGEELAVPKGCQVIDVTGKHLSPGIIDCHSHMATDGGINESGQAVTAEVRIGDFMDNSDIDIYRQLAGGVTTANVLHGSANPIGGQNQVIKLRWGGTMDDLPMQEAPAGIKFALGENVKRNTSRYPNTRMGVQQIIRDQFLTGREYNAKWKRWRAGERDSLPPRTDLQLEAIGEIIRGERWIHCHSYRQDEIVATLELLNEFNVRIGTLQHILEGYKAADQMAKYKAMGSSFADWWAYKYEVFDAIPYNGALMREQGVVVSFNSDDRELARHLNTEAAKATKYGGVPPAEALQFVTLNPAKQLRIDEFVGSLTPGKHADVVVWSGRPLSTTSRCEQTWIEGKRYFDLQSDQQMRKRDADLHARLVQKVLLDGKSPVTKASVTKATASAAKQVEEELRWYRFDIFCTANGHAGYVRRLQESENE